MVGRGEAAAAVGHREAVGLEAARQGGDGTGGGVERAAEEALGDGGLGHLSTPGR